MAFISQHSNADAHKTGSFTHHEWPAMRMERTFLEARERKELEVMESLYIRAAKKYLSRSSDNI